jgi:hypothetical protein
MWLDELQDEIAARLDNGERLERVQADVVDSARGLGEEERDALWLFAWSYEASRGDTYRRTPLGAARV